MRNRFGLLFKIMICILLVLSLTGCWNRRELDTLGIVMGTGIDKGDKYGEVKVTAQIVKPEEIKSQGEGGGGGSGKAYWNIDNTGNTVFGAIRGLTHQSNRKLFYPHNQVLIFSQDIAKEGVRKYVDFFMRDGEPRLNNWFLVSKGKTGEAFDVKPELEKVPAMNIAHLVEDQVATSETSMVKLKDFATRLMSKTTAPIAPWIEVSGEKEKKAVTISGTAVFKKDKLVGELNERETRGLLWVLGEVKSGIIEVDCPEGNGKIVLEIIRAESKITPEIKDGKIHIKVQIREEENLAEDECDQSIETPAQIDFLKKESAAAIRGEVMASLIKARRLNADIYGFGDTLHQKHPQQWKELEKEWDEFFPQLEVEVKVRTILHTTGKINKAVMPE